MGGSSVRDCLRAQRARLFSWTEWAAALADEIRAAQGRGEPDTGETYYHHWLAALERLVIAKRATDAETLAHHREA